MTTEPIAITAPGIGSAAESEMIQLGITRAPVDYFHYKEFKYTNLKDAIAQATLQANKD